MLALQVQALQGHQVIHQDVVIKENVVLLLTVINERWAGGRLLKISFCVSNNSNITQKVKNLRTD